MVKWWKPIALVLLTFLLAVSLKSDFLYFLLGLELMVELAAFCQVLWLSGRVEMRLVLPRTRVLRGETFQIQAELTNNSHFPIPQLMVRLAVRCFPETEELLLKGKLMLDGKERGSLCFRLDGSHCGCLEIRPDKMAVTDFLGIFQRRVRVAEESTMLFLLPQVLKTEQPDLQSQGFFSDDTGDSEGRGSGAADTCEIRAYRKGDKLKLVHWKLTARLKELMVRELSENTEKLTWLYLRLQEDAYSPRREPEVWDHFLETVASVSAELLELEERHMVLWMDGGALTRYCVSDDTTRQEMLCALLRAEPGPSGDLLLLKEIMTDETKATCIEIDLQGNLVRAELP